MKTEKIIEPERFSSSELTQQKLRKGLENALSVIDKNTKIFFGNVFPAHSSINGYYGKWTNTGGDGMNVGGWNTGFWSGILWLAYELTGDAKYRETAMGQIDSFYERIEKKIGVNHHDMGFLYTPSCVAAYKLTGDKKAKEAALMAAKHLCSRYNKAGEFIQAWGNVGDDAESRLIIDCMLNIPLLYWASTVTGDQSFDQIACRHFKTTVKNIFREDGSTFHTYFFDKITGEPLRGVTHQGWSDNSCWARGQAWGIYGIPLTSKYHFDKAVIPVFKAAANYFINRLPEDFVPYWDMCFTDGDMPRDSSSAAIAVCGILEMLKYLDDEADRRIYKNAADCMMESLIENYAVKDADKSNGLLLHGTYFYKGNEGVDECNIWGDYFYMEALARYLIQDWKLYW